MCRGSSSPPPSLVLEAKFAEVRRSDSLVGKKKKNLNSSGKQGHLTWVQFAQNNLKIQKS